VKILYLGALGGPTSTARRPGALRRLGHELTLVDPRDALPSGLLVDWWCFHYAALGLEAVINRYVLRQAGSGPYDIVFVDVGSLVGKTLVRKLKSIATKVICFNQDNPFTSRDGGRWRLFLKAMREYDLIAVPRASTALAARQNGARKVVRICLHADEELVRSARLTPEARAKYASEVAFVGTWMPERGAFMLRLIELGVPLRIFGPRWHKAPEFPLIEKHVTLGPLIGAEYASAIAASRISLVLLSKGNEDLHTSRSSEIPAIGRLLCGERTSEHLEMYDEGDEAVFFDNAEECAEKCLALLADPQELERIALAGHLRVQRNQTFSEPQLKSILDAAMLPNEDAADISTSIRFEPTIAEATI